MIFVLLMTLYHCYLKKQHQKELEGVILRDDDELDADVEGMRMFDEQQMMEQVELQRKLRAHKVGQKVGKFGAVVETRAKSLSLEPGDRFM